MSASKNPDAMNSSQGEFSSRVAPSEPLTTKGHAPGIKVGNDRYPEFNLETHPPGTAPRENTFEPNPAENIPGQANNEFANSEGVTSASATLGGATSADVHQGLGHPGSGMTSQEQHHTKRGQRAGLEGVGASGSDPQHEHLHDRPYETGTRGISNAGAGDRGVEFSEGASAEERASEVRQRNTNEEPRQPLKG